MANVSIEKVQQLTNTILTASESELDKLVEKEEKDVKDIAKRMAVINRTRLATFAALDDKLSENAVYDAAKAANGLVTSINNGISVYKAGRWLVDWFRT